MRFRVLTQARAEFVDPVRLHGQSCGKRMTAVVEGYDKYAGCYFGRTAADAPDIDGKVFIKSDSRLRLGQYITVEVFDTMDYDLLAEEVTDEPAE